MLGHRIWCAWSGGALVGLLIVRVDKPEDGVLPWSVLDLVLGSEPNEVVLRALVHHMMEDAWQAGITHVRWIIHRRDIAKLLVSWGFSDRSDDFCTMSLSSRSPMLATALEAEADWSIGEIHMDSD
jgi:hypothetical protein